MLGYNETNKTFRIWDLKRRKAILTRDVKIFEKTKPNQQEQNQEESSDEESEERIRSEDESEESDSYESDEEIDSDESKESEEEVEKQKERENREEKFQDFVIRIEKCDSKSYEDHQQSKEKETSNQQNDVRRSTRDRKKPEELGKVKMYLAEDAEGTPTTYQQMLKEKEKEKWIKSTQKELDSLTTMQTFEVVDRPTNKPTITSKWLWKIKYQ